MCFANGFLITSEPRTINNILYHGIDTCAWPVPEDELENIFCEKQRKAYEQLTDDLLVGENDICLLGFDLMTKYVEYCKKKNYLYRVLYIEVKNEHLGLEQYLHDKFAKDIMFMGYDIGICAYDYYSALLADVIARPSFLNDEIIYKLNHFGLFPSINDVDYYLQLRNDMQKWKSNALEGGTMRIMSIYGVTV